MADKYPGMMHGSTAVLAQNDARIAELAGGGVDMNLWRGEYCKWCRSEDEYPLVGHCHWMPDGASEGAEPCTAPSPEEHIAAQAQRIARLDATVNQLTEYCAELNDDATHVSIQRDEARAALKLATGVLERIRDDAAVSKRLNSPPLSMEEVVQMCTCWLTEPAIVAEVERQRKIAGILNHIEGVIAESSHQGSEWEASELRAALFDILRDAK